jgi:hypothetical protein
VRRKHRESGRGEEEIARRRTRVARAFRQTARRAGSAVAIEVDSERYLQARLALLQEKLHQVDRLAGQGELPDAEITGELLKVSPLKKAVPEDAEQLEEEAFVLMPHLKSPSFCLRSISRPTLRVTLRTSGAASWPETARCY